MPLRIGFEAYSTQGPGIFLSRLQAVLSERGYFYGSQYSVTSPKGGDKQPEELQADAPEASEVLEVIRDELPSPDTTLPDDDGPDV